MHIAVSHSDEIESLAAALELVESAERELGGLEPKAGVLFASVDYDHDEVLAFLTERWPDIRLVGATSDGELSGSLGFRHDSLVLTLFAGDELEVFAGLGQNLSQDPERALNEALAGSESFVPDLCITLFAPTTDGCHVVTKLNERFSQPCPILGGLSGDHREFAHHRELFGAASHADSLLVLLLRGPLHVSWGLGSGWSPLGGDYEITSSDGHVVREIDHRPATEVYGSHFGSLPSSRLGEYPLAVFPNDTDDWVLRAIVHADEETGVVQFVGAVPQGSRVRLTQVLPEGLLQGSRLALEAALDTYSGSEPLLAMVFSCAARKWVLGTKAESEIDVLRQVANERGLDSLAISGLYVYGEIAPPVGRDHAEFHNETCVTLVLGR